MIAFIVFKAPKNHFMVERMGKGKVEIPPTHETHELTISELSPLKRTIIIFICFPSGAGIAQSV
jgi:hypothetical protein